MWLAIGWLACDGKHEFPPTDDSEPIGGPELPVEITVDGQIVFDGVADAPENGLYQPAADGDCAPSRRVGVFEGSDVYLEIPFPGQFPVGGSEVVFPSSVDEPGVDWDVAGWRDADDVLWAAYGGVATLVDYGADGVEIALSGATVCASDRLGSLEDPEALWRDHTTDCAPGADVVFRTKGALPFDPAYQTWCSAGRPGSWQTPDGVVLCSVDRLPCEVDAE